MQCHFCGKPVEGLPFHCNYCGYIYCGEHRLPENHACPRVGGPIQPGYAKVNSPRNQPRNNPSGIPLIGSDRRRFRLRYSNLFSKVEQKHILVATAVMVLVGLSLSPSFGLYPPALLLVLIPGFVVSFLGHELAHKFLARRNGLWAEFRTSRYGLLLTAISVIVPFKFLAPGQVNITGNGSKEALGAIGLIGPGLNIVLGVATLVVYKMSIFWLGPALITLSQFNGWLALINLIPFGSLDGTRVFEWDKTRWMIALAAAAALLILSTYAYLI